MTTDESLRSKRQDTRRQLPLEKCPDHDARVSDVDAELIRQSLCGDSHAFACLVNRHQGRLFHSMAYLVGNRAEAEDVVQEALLQCFLKLHTFAGRSEFYVWLYAIALNVARSRIRRRRVEISLDELCRPPGLEPVAEPSSDSAERREESELVQSALKAVGARHRAILILRDMEGFSYERISETLGLPVGTVRSRLHRARMALRRSYDRLTRSPALRAESGRS